MRNTILLFVLPGLFCFAGCTSDQMGASNNPHPRRTYNAETGNYQGPTPMPASGSNASDNR